MPTINDVAKKAKVSVSTVSYAINGTRPISEETRRKIFSVMGELGYQPNAMARGLASKKTRILALLFPDAGLGLNVTALSFFTSTAEAARKHGYSLLLWPTVQDSDDLRAHLQQGLVEGVVVMEISLQDERVQLLRELNFPFSMIGRTSDTTGLSYVDYDIRQSIFDAVKYLQDLGHRHIAYINNDKVNTGYGPSVRAQESFQQAMQAYGGTATVRTAMCAPNAGYEAFNTLLGIDPHITAIVTINDYAVPGVALAAANRGWSIPNDLSIIVGPTSFQMSEIITPPLTFIDIPIVEMSRVGVRMLVQKLENKEAELTQALIPCQLILRSSTGPARVNNLA